MLIRGLAIVCFVAASAALHAQPSPTTEMFYNGGNLGPAPGMLSPRAKSVAPVLSEAQQQIAERMLKAASPSQRPFLNYMIPAAAYLQRNRGIPFSATLAMAVYESDYGRSKLATEHHNYFGIKASASSSSSWQGGKALLPTVDSGEKVKAWFRSYPTVRAGVLDYAELLTTSPRYAKAFESGDGISFVASVLNGGYCPDGDYLDNIRTIMTRHQMGLLDTPRVALAVEKRQVAQAGR